MCGVELTEQIRPAFVYAEVIIRLSEHREHLDALLGVNAVALGGKSVEPVGEKRLFNTLVVLEPLDIGLDLV